MDTFGGLLILFGILVLGMAAYEGWTGTDGAGSTAIVGIFFLGLGYVLAIRTPEGGSPDNPGDASVESGETFAADTVLPESAPVSNRNKQRQSFRSFKPVTTGFSIRSAHYLPRTRGSPRSCLNPGAGTRRQIAMTCPNGSR